MMSERKKPVSVRQLAFTPQWIAMLVLALIVAAVFAWLGKWQIERAIIQGAKDSYDTEVAVPLESITEPGKPMVLEAGGRRVTFDATLDRGSLIVVGNRSNEGVIGCWVTGRLVGNSGALAVALGWAPTLDECESVRESMSGMITIQALQPWVGRYSPAEGPNPPPGNTSGVDPTALNYMSVAALYNLWPESSSPVYAGYLIAEGLQSDDSPAPEGQLSEISSSPPITDASLNILNIFYALEWALFAAGAVFLWWRLLRDDFERRTEDD